ncbi:hypothetical protein [Pseudomonas sp. 10S4]|uniref:hypothetical protein n=1 Tax=Pseudomonas sp. 10S4 TaxID=3048583 RepID=UPI002AC95638|nr:MULTISPECIES: hypothetical protein [unclassified Pseudomonas]MEB0226298.1 hypothetical protein [Pseudomonas sp. 5S1]MEB0294881.1 hypothetical protein [Pseudomonas sp. 10S4]WPX18172.1 hypothetical protein RHM58_31245 [Pseudomonas sp. 10S4]
MAADGKARSAKAALKRQAMREVELRHTVRCGIKQMLSDLMCWNDISEMGEALQLLILNAVPESALLYRNTDIPLMPAEMIRHHARQGIQDRLDDLAGRMFGASHKHVIELLILCAHDAGPEGSVGYLQIPRHEITINENVSRKLKLACDRESLRICSDE